MISWRPVVIVLLFVAAWDVIGLAFGDSLYLSPSYDVLREVAGSFSFAGHTPGMRFYALGLAIISAALTYAMLAQRRRRGAMTRLLSFALSGLAAWWVAWCLGIAMAFIRAEQVNAWGGLGKLLGISAIAVLAARVPPPIPTSDTPTGDKG